MAGSVILGFFDGVHTAHRKIIKKAVESAGEQKCTLITFKQSPSEYFCGKNEYLMTRKDSIEKIRAMGVGEIMELDFSEIADITAENYIEFLVKTYNPSAIYTGYNHTFGKDKKGTPEMLKEYASVYGYKYFCVSEQTYNGETISTTHIKELISKGEVEHANILLGSNFILSGKVIKGTQIGRSIGFPTANFEYPENIVKLPYGVYKVSANIDNYNNMPAIMNWGIKPTLNNTIAPIAEVHIVNFNENLYGKNIKVEVLEQIRTEKKFNNIDELKIQIEKDIECLK